MNDDMMQRKGERERQREREREREREETQNTQTYKNQAHNGKTYAQKCWIWGARDEERERMRGKIAVLITIGCFPAHADFNCFCIGTA
jgi:hypothetical protein